MTTAPVESSTEEAAPVGPPPRTITADLERVFQRISDISCFPEIARRVLEVAGQEDVSIDDLLGVIEQEPVLAIKILQTVNSSYYGLSHEVADLRTAVALLGIKQVRNMALTVVVGRHFTAPAALGIIDPADLWDHAVSTAVGARLVAQKTGAADPDEAYLAGLIHDTGLLVIDQKLESQMPRVVQRFKENKSWMEAEQEVLSFDHAQLGAYVAWRSGFPHRLVAAVDYHHNPTEADKEIVPLSAIVAVSNYLVSRLGRTVMADRRTPPPLEIVFEDLDLDRRAIRSLRKDLDIALDSVEELKRV